MALDELFKRRTLLAAVNSPDLKVRPRFFVDKLFSRSRAVFSQYVDFEVVKGSNGLARFRQSGAAGNIVGKGKRTVQTVKLPYIREKKVLTAQELINENSLGNVYVSNGSSIDQARQVALNRELQDLKNRILRREEWMAAQMLTKGKIEYEDEETAFVIDWALPSEFKPTLSGTSVWGGADADIDTNLDNWNIEINKATGTNANICILGTTAAQKFKKDPTVLKNLDTNNYRTGALVNDVKSNYLGSYNGIDFFRYSNQYTDENGDTIDMMPANMAILVSENFADTAEILYGLIEEADQTFAGQVFSKSWVENDPSERWLLTASRPLTMQTTAGLWVAATVTA